MKLLLVEDDQVLAAGLVEQLQAFEHQVVHVVDGRQGLRALDDDHFDAVILDWMLPRLDGVSVLTTLRARDVTTPIIMLSALGQSAEKVRGLEAGADDYVVKPVAASELHARLGAVLRARKWARGGSGMLRAGDILVSPEKFRAWRNGKAIDLSHLELNLLAELARNVDTVLTRAMLLERVWAYDFEPSTNIVDVFIRRLRVKLTAAGGDDPIATLRGVGYMLRG
ncbi:DNA-binding response regulator [Caulobacter sp. CCUG 60055]|uniref:response regulator transcription factor n=1 Tax=Caulobacter sp. CCUG 60055 TaxID=2100090 RepID=UPI001FA7871A|nr:response regulator transcription factor [Caulobacter sp. CCUG 60055]MCI3179543.1 DNA-binding response regulator [Caulobacter sp. CCUG 60055]